MKNELLHNNSIKLRAIEPEDIDQFYQWENDTSYWEQGNTIVPFSRYALKQYIEQASLDVYEIKEMRLIIERKEDAVCLGTIDVSNIDFFNKRAEMGVLIDKMHQKNGYAVMAIDILLTYLFTYLDLEQVFCHVPIHNIASQNMLLRAGFVCSGQKRNWIRKDSQFEDVLFYQKLR
jgi:diamine N-acetyltransferase